MTALMTEPHAPLLLEEEMPVAAPESRPARKFGDAIASDREWGKIVCWSMSGRVRHKDLVGALNAAGLDTGVARAVVPKNAWLRACRSLETNRIIRQVGRDGSRVTFQFTSEKPRSGEDRLDYEFETKVSLDVTDGKLACDDADLLAKAQAVLDESMELRTGNDVTECIKRLFKKSADIFPLVGGRGVYFVPAEHNDFVDRVYACVKRLGGEMARCGVPLDTEDGDRTARTSAVAGIGERIEELRRAVEAWDEDTRKGTIRRAVARVQVARAKIRGFAKYLGDQQQSLFDTLAEVDAELRSKVLALGKEVPTV